MIPDQRPPDRLALITLVVSNLMLVIFALAYRWSYYAPLVVFWFEIVIIGVYNVVKMFVTAIAGDAPLGRWIGFADGWSAILSTVLLIVFFTVKFGGFILGLGFLTILMPAFFDQEAGGMAVLDAIDTAGPSIATAVIILVISHGVSFLRNFIWRKEYESANLIVLLIWPYLRGLCLYGTILVGALIGLGLPIADRSTAFAIGLVIVKLGADVVTHRFEHARFGRAANDGQRR